MDAVDLVTREQLRAEHRFEQHRKALAAKPVPPSATDCAECGNDIPEGRRSAIKGVQLCTECQSLSEK
ncbi:MULTISPECIES: TraR/DksA C4-type zinc finger protein [unclassified Shewanella]|uniref:TraR/DksA C4-type zinc finger protein n=1 Tax=unclassified Shewanella TaxID=196818 RepID=UPI0021D9424D|nr:MULTISPECIES: TraR/DksA C4-type zinc finger protein [unclassified Shewanella]MCU8032756.1 TraR/DksA C4-type zinc finger protein [Shewanella sp. SM71]MCU8094642.1 TraR/DksA C4-type zinc finger protein [Shewanella sp. SM102]